MAVYKNKVFFDCLWLIIVCISIFLSSNVFASQTDEDALLTIPSGVGFNESVYIVTPQGSNKMLAGGEFTGYNGYSTNKIIRLYTDGSIDTSFDIGSGFNDAIRAIVIQDDGKILVGGHFTNYNGTIVNRIVRLNTDGSIDTSFVTGSGFNAQVRTIAIQSDGKILVGGAITNYNGTTIYRIVRLNTNGTIDTSFNIGLGFNNNIRSIVIQDDGKIILAGGFVVYNGTTTNRIIRVNSNGSRDDTFVIGSGFNEQINSVLLSSDGKILVGGFFTGYNGTSLNRIARLNPNGSIDTSFDVGDGFNSQVISFVVDNEKIIVGGAFTTYDSVTANNIICLNPNGSIDTSFDFGLGFDNAVRLINRQPDGKILIGGDFTSYKGASFGRLIRLHGNSYISLLDTDNEDVIRAEFTSKGYTLSGEILSGSEPMVFVDTLGRIPTALTLKNNNILLTLPQNIQIKNKSNNYDYTGTFFPPTPIPLENNPNADFAFSVGSNETSLELSNGVAILSLPVTGKNIGDTMYIYYSEDNSTTWLPHTKTNIIEYNNQTYVTFTTDHFTDFSIGSYTGNFFINNDATTTSTDTVTLNINSPGVINIRFSNDGTHRSSWETYTTSKIWTLSAGYGVKIVYAQFDADGDQISDAQTSDTINYTDGSSGGTCEGGEGVACLNLEITAVTGECRYGINLDLGDHAQTYNAFTMTGAFLSNHASTTKRSCNDTAGKSPWNMQISSTDLVAGSYSIANTTIEIKTAELIKYRGSNSFTGLIGAFAARGTNLSTPRKIFEKTSPAGTVGEIGTDTVDLRVLVPTNQEVGAYQATITIAYPQM